MDKIITNNSIKHSVEEVTEREDHAELINGAIFVNDKTSVEHNNAVLEIATALKQFIKADNSKHKVFTENVVLYCNELSGDYSLFLPDVMLVCDESGIKDDGIHTAPVFVAEITSETTRRNDYVRKMLTYSDMGVKEYWVVDLQRKAIIRYLLEEDYAPEEISYPNKREICMNTYPSLKIDLSLIFG